MLVQVNPISDIRPRVQAIQVLLKRRSKVFVEVERHAGTAEGEMHFQTWKSITKEIETLQTSANIA